jgi:hypothetical protein
MNSSVGRDIFLFLFCRFLARHSLGLRSPQDPQQRNLGITTVKLIVN